MLWFWVVVLVVLIGAIAVVAAGRGDAMAEVYEDRPDATLPTGRPLTADDLRGVRLNTGVRGYRMDEVDALLARLEADLLAREEESGVQVRRDGRDAATDRSTAPERRAHSDRGSPEAADHPENEQDPDQRPGTDREAHPP